MKSAIFIAVISFLVVSCAKKPSEIAEKLSGKICRELNKDFSVQSLGKAKLEFNSAVEKEANKEIFFKALEKCMLSLKYGKTINESNVLTDIQGTANPYLALVKNNYTIELKGDGNPAFSTLLKLKALKKAIDTNISKVDGNLTLLDKSRNIIDKYKIYHLPDFVKLLRTGTGDATFRVFLDPVCDPLSKQPFDIAVNSLKKIESAVCFELELNIFYSDTDKEKESSKSDKEYEDILKKLDGVK